MNTPQPGESSVRLIHRGDGWAVREIICSAGPESRPFEERHDGFTIASVLAGTFTYHGANGRALLHPGALLFGNHGACYECGHAHGRGDRCIAINLSPALFEEIASAGAMRRSLPMPVSMLPACHDSLPLMARIAALPGRDDHAEIEELVLALAMKAMALCAQAEPPCRVSAAIERKILAAVRHIESAAHLPLTLQDLAAGAGLSRSHFLRQFHRITRMTPLQYVLNLRLRRAAQDLERNSRPVIDIAFDQGFGDLSTFMGHFKRRFGQSPARYRKRVSARGPYQSRGR